MARTLKSKVNTWLLYKIFCTIKWIFVTIVQVGFHRIRVTIEEHFEDKKLGVETSDFTSFENVPSAFTFGINRDGKKYQPTYYKKLKKCAEYLAFQKDDVLVDIGAGKGRALFFFSKYKLKKVIGIEFKRELAEIARKNLAHVKGGHCPIEIVEGDAANADLSEGTIYFLYNAFGPATLTNVLNSISESLKVRPRKIRILYMNGIHMDLISSQDWLEKEGVVGNPEDTVWRSKTSV